MAPKIVDIAVKKTAETPKPDFAFNDVLAIVIFKLDFEDNKKVDSNALK